MANDNKLDEGFDEVPLLDDGFEEVTLDEGFSEVPMKASAPKAEPVKRDQYGNPKLSEGEFGIPGFTLSQLNDRVKSSDNVLGAFGMGAAQGATLDFADEIAGGIGALGAAFDPSDGAVKDNYTKYRDMVRAKDVQLKKESPYSYGIGQVSGAIAPALATMGGSVAAVTPTIANVGLIQAAKFAGKQAVKEGAKGAAIGAGAGVAQELGQAEQLSDVSEDSLLDAAGSGAAIGGLLGGGISGLTSTARLVGKGIGKLDDTLTFQHLKASHKAGREGEVINSSRSSTIEQTANRNKDIQDVINTFKKTDDELSATASKATSEREALQLTKQAEHEASVASQKAAKQVEHESLVLEGQKKLDAAYGEFEKTLQAQQISKNSEEFGKFTEANQKLINQSEKLESVIATNQKQIGKGIEDISDELAGNKNIVFNTLDDVENLVSDLKDHSTMSMFDPTKLIERLNEFAGENVDYNKFRQMKAFLDKLSKSEDRTVAGMAKRARGQMNQKLTAQVEASILDAAKNGVDPGMSLERVRQLKELNNRYTATKELEEVVDRAKTLYSTGEKGAESGNIRLLRNLNDPKAETKAVSDQFKSTFERAVGPDAAPFLNESTALSDELKMLGKVEDPALFTPKVSKADVTSAMDNVGDDSIELLRAQASAKQAPFIAPEAPAKLMPDANEISFLEKLKEYRSKVMQPLGADKNPARLDAGVERLLDKTKLGKGTNLKSTGKMLELEQGIREYEVSNPGWIKSLGFESTDDFIKSLDNKQSIAAVRQLVSDRQSIISNSSGLIEDVLSFTKNKSLAVANLVGRGQGPVSSKVRPTVAKYLSDATPEVLKHVATQLSSVSGISHLGTALKRAVQSGDQFGRNATIFSIMQNPNARKYIDTNLTEEDSSSEE